MSKSDYEGSKKDRLMDRKQARKKKMSLREWEASPEDNAADAKGFAGGGSVARGSGKALRGFDYTIR